MSSTLNRRTFIQGAAAGAAALALPVDAMASSPRAPVTLEFWNPASDPVGKLIITKLVNDFNNGVGKASGIFVKSRIVSTSSGVQAYTKYTTAMTSSGSPDVVMTYEYTPVGAWAGNGFIQPLDAYAKAVGIKQGDFFPVSWQMINFGNHIWGLLQEFDFNQFWWNKKIHTGPPPKTIAELDALAAKYTKFDKKGNLVQVGIIPWAVNGGGNTDWNTLWGGRWYDHAAGKWTINRPENRRWLEWMLKYVHMFGGRSKADALISSTPTVYAAGDNFLWGQAAFGMEGEFIPAEVKQLKLKINFGIAYPPTGPGVPYGTNTTGGGNLFLLPTKCPHPKEAVTFIQYMGTKAVLPWCVPNSNIPPTREAANSASFNKALPKLKPWIDTLTFNHMVPPASSPQQFLFATSILNTVNEVTYLKKTPAQALAELDHTISSAVQTFKQFHPTWPAE